MIGNALTKIFGTSNERTVKRMLPTVAAINALEPEMQRLSHEQMRAKTDKFRAQIAARTAGIEDAEERYEAERAALDGFGELEVLYSRPLSPRPGLDESPPRLVIGRGIEAAAQAFRWGCRSYDG